MLSIFNVGDGGIIIDRRCMQRRIDALPKHYILTARICLSSNPLQFAHLKSIPPTITKILKENIKKEKLNASAPLK